MSELSRAMQDSRRRQMTHYDSYGQDRNPNAAFDNTPEAWAHGVYNSAPNLMGAFEMAAPYTLPGMLAEYFNPGGGQEMASAMLSQGLGTDELNAAYTPQSGYQSLVSLAGEAAADPMDLIGLPWLAGKGLKNLPKFIGQAMTDLRQHPSKAMRGMIGYHGSPHKFDAFDHTRMGSGEGAQAYGWGTYIAENPDVAGGYNARLSGAEDLVLKIRKYSPSLSSIQISMI